MNAAARTELIIRLKAEVADGKLVQEQLCRAIGREKNENAQLLAQLAALTRKLEGKLPGPIIHRTDYDAA